MSKTEELPTLAEIKRRAKEEVEEDQEDIYGRRYRTINYTSEETRAPGDNDLLTYYCSVCGTHCLVLEGDLSALPKFEKTLVVETEKAFHKSYMTNSDTVYIKRPEGVETRIMMRCRLCDYPISYRVKDEDIATKYLYIFKDGLVSNQTGAATFAEPAAAAVSLEPGLAQ